MSTTGIVFLSILGAIVLAGIVYLCIVPLKTYFNALFDGAYVSTFKLVSMKSRKLDYKQIVEAYIMAKKSKVNLTLADIESLYLSQANVIEIIKALNLAKKSKINLDLTLASAIELNSNNVYQIVRASLNSRKDVIEDVSGITQDNYEISAVVNLSTKINLANYINGLELDDLKGNIGAWIMENISKQTNYRNIFKEPNKTLLGNLDLKLVTKNSRYFVVDISVDSVNLKRDLNMEKEIKIAEKEKVYAEIEAERMKNSEEIKEIRQRAKTEEMKSALLEAEAEVPKALTSALQSGSFSAMDYYKLMNLQADTAMRRSLIDNKNKKRIDDDDDFDDFDFDDDDEGDDF